MIKNEIINAINVLNYETNCLLIEDKWFDVNNEIEKRYIINKIPHYAMWDAIEFDESEYNVDGYLKTEKLKNKECFLFVENEKGCLFLIKDGYIIKDIIGECFLFEYYIIDINYEWIVCNNHHDYLLTKNIKL